MGSKDVTVVGRPFIDGVKVVCVVEEISKAAKVFIAKFKKRKRYQRFKGYRHD